MAYSPKVAVIVVHYNGFHHTVECLESLARQKYPESKIILIDNASAGIDGMRLRTLFPDIHLIRNAENRGFAGGNNDGIRWALRHGFDYIVTLNNDCLVAPDWLVRLVAGVHSAEADFASAQVRYYPETDFICSDELVLLPDGSGRTVNLLKKAPAAERMRPIFSASATAAMYSAACLEAVKLTNDQFFDELFFAYLEDLDLGIRLNAKGFRGVYVPDAVVYHKEAQTAGFRSRFQLFHLEKNRILVELLNYPAWMLPVGEFFYGIKTLCRIVQRFFKKKKVIRPVVHPPEAGSAFAILLQSRLWILKQSAAILRDRRDRIARGLINTGIYKKFYWNLWS